MIKAINDKIKVKADKDLKSHNLTLSQSRKKSTQKKRALFLKRTEFKSKDAGIKNKRTLKIKRRRNLIKIRQNEKKGKSCRYYYKTKRNIMKSV